MTKYILDNRLVKATLSAGELVDLPGRETFDKFAMAANHR